MLGRAGRILGPLVLVALTEMNMHDSFNKLTHKVL